MGRSVSITAILVVGVGLLVVAVLLQRASSAPLEGDARHADEESCPLSESYRRLQFVLDLNPVAWDQVRDDVATIESRLRVVSSGDADRYRRGVTAAIDGDEPRRDGHPSRTRKATGRAVFVLSTRAVARTVIHQLRTADERGEVGRAGAVTEARCAWNAFRRTIEVSDPRASARLERRWKELSENPRGGGGAVGPTEDEGVRRAVQEIVAYLDANYGEAFQPPAGGPLVPLPVHSATFEAGKVVPPELPPGHNIGIQLPRPRHVLNMALRGVDERETALIALGDMAFNSPHIFGDPARSLGITCNTCHNKGATNPQFFVPGLSARPGGIDVSNSFLAPHANNGHFDHMDTPDLRGIRYTSPYGRNGRFPSLREFIRNGIIHEFNGPEPDPLVVDAIVAYVNEIDFLPNPYLNADGSLNETASPGARRGETIFRTRFARLGDRSCAACHVPSDHFIDRRRHDIGTVAGTGLGSRDRALDTPTLLGVKFTAPYFHDGSQPTLRAVSEWFNERFALELTDAQVADLTAYLETVGDGTDPYEQSANCLEAEFREFEFFLSTYEFLREREKPGLMEILFETVATEIRRHETLLQDEAHLPTMRRLLQLMEEAAAACRRGDRETVAARVAHYRDLYQKNAAYLR